MGEDDAPDDPQTEGPIPEPSADDAGLDVELEDLTAFTQTTDILRRTENRKMAKRESKKEKENRKDVVAQKRTPRKDPTTVKAEGEGEKTVFISTTRALLLRLCKIGLTAEVLSEDETAAVQRIVARLGTKK